MFQTFRVGRTRVVSHGEKSFNNSCALIVLAIFAVVIPCIAIWAEHERYEKTVAYDEASKIIFNLPSDTPNYDHSGKLVHFQTRQVSTPDRLGDPDFHLSFHNSLRLQRVVEYCQWQEHVHDRTEKDRDGNDVTYRTYTYTKGWHSSPIPSLFFDQPGAHHNPQRDPYPKALFQVQKANVGGYSLTPGMISRMQWFNKISSFGSATINEFMTSPAALENQFRYIGQGYFYSKYQASGFEKLAKTLVELAEGSLLDYQIGDLFSSCTAGDIRVSYQSVEIPKDYQQGVSVIGQVVDTNKIDLYTSSREYQIGLISLGQHTAKEMFDADIRAHFWTVLGTRFLIVLWSFGILCLLRANRHQLPVELSNIESLFDAWYAPLLPTLFIAGTALGLIWAFFWGPALTNIGVLAISTVGLYLLLQPRAVRQTRQQQHQREEMPPSASEGTDTKKQQ